MAFTVFLVDCNLTSIVSRVSVVLHNVRGETSKVTLVFPLWLLCYQAYLKKYGYLHTPLDPQNMGIQTDNIIEALR